MSDFPGQVIYRRYTEKKKQKILVNISDVARLQDWGTYGIVFLDEARNNRFSSLILRDVLTCK